MKNQIKSGVLYIFLFIFCNILLINNINAQYLQKLGGSSKVYEYGNTDSAKIGIGLINPTAKFQIKTNINDNVPFKIDAKITRNNLPYDFGSIECFATTDNLVYGIYQTATSENTVLNYFQSPTKFNKITLGAYQNHAGMNMDIGISDFTFSMKEAPTGPTIIPLQISTNGISVAGKVRTGEFQLLTDPGKGKVLVCDESGNGSWTDASSFHDDDWLETREFDDKIDPPPSAQKSLYLNPIYWNVGIGTDNPKSMLHVVDGNIMISRSPSKASGSKNGSILFGEVITDLCPRGEWGIEYYSPDSTSNIDSTYSSGGLNFWKVYTEGHDNHGFNYALYLRNDGNVGIGTPVTYGYKLAVTGKVLCEELKVKLVTQWPDYVLSPGHKLLSLNELDHFIKENNHLPDLPSAKEVEEKGINVGEMNGVLLKKIEELTIYIIAMQKEMDQLKAKISGQ